ncbi:TatD family hydrolase [Flavobacteriales bacterium]|nr:TatD family hydrolase [Flavobacteriales bacterium]
MIDTHTHMFSSQFDQDREQIVKECIESGIETLLLPNINSETIDAMWSLCDLFPKNCFPMIGLHPCDVKEDYQKELEIVLKELKNRKYVAVGEIGIDLHWDKTTEDIQKKAFDQQIKWAIEFDLPIAIHIRESFEEVFEVLEQNIHPKLRGVFHCFTGTLEQAQKAISMGFMLGVGGVVTFKNSGVDKVIENVDLKHLVLETDSPYLAPTPLRGKRNDSRNLQLICDKLAQLNDLESSEVARITSKNAKTLFKL